MLRVKLPTTDRRPTSLRKRQPIFCLTNKMTNADRYHTLHPAFADAFTFLRNTEFGSLPDGRNEIDGERLYAMVIRGQGKENRILEAHRDYIDIQFTVTGSDLIGWEETARCVENADGYLAEQDVVLLTSFPSLLVNVAAGRFAVFFPEDAHAPMGCAGPVEKIVVKVKI